MERRIIELKNNRYHHNLEIDHFEDKCSLCHFNIHLDQDDMLGHNFLSENRFEVFFKCPHCKKAIITGYYKPTSGKVYLYQNTLPLQPEKIYLAEELNNLSSQFNDIYKEAYSADQYGLKHIAGLGYRKALEFLIKDYLINYKQENAEKIKSQFLGEVIKLIPHDRIRLGASRAAWLGNDENHYTRIYDNKDVNDLKMLLDITINYIVNEIKLDNYEKDMPDKK